MPVTGSVPVTGIVLVAAGSGTRLGAAMPKAFVELGGEPMLAHALRGLRGLPGRVALVIAVPAGDTERARVARSLAERELAVLGDRLVAVTTVAGGATRHASVQAALDAIPDEADIVLVHDAARALTPQAVVAEVAAAVRATATGVVPVLPVVDTIKRVGDGTAIVETVDRSTLRAVQTPQGFPTGVLRAAYRDATSDETDDAGVVAAAGFPVETVAGSERAFKITTPADLARAERMLHDVERAARDTEFRVGTGVDVHAFDATAPCWVAGLFFAGEPGLSGHSDGDAAAHALVDALLGAAGLGDIGSRFGVSDPRYAGAGGTVFLEATRDLLAQAGFRIRNASVQIVGQRPRLGARREEAAQVLGAAIGAPVSVSATTTDRLGFTGREEGVLAIATALVEGPGRSLPGRP